VGVEVRKSMYEHSLRAAHAAGVSDSLTFLRANTELTHAAWLSRLPGPLQVITVLNPDPCWKKRQAKRRLLNPYSVRVLALYAALGRCEFVLQTDVKSLHDYHQAVMDDASAYFERVDLPGVVNTTDAPTHATLAQASAPLYIGRQSPREAKVLARGLPIFRSFYRRTQTPITPEEVEASQARKKLFGYALASEEERMATESLFREIDGPNQEGESSGSDSEEEAPKVSTPRKGSKEAFPSAAAAATSASATSASASARRSRSPSERYLSDEFLQAMARVGAEGSTQDRTWDRAQDRVQDRAAVQDLAPRDRASQFRSRPDRGNDRASEWSRDRGQDRRQTRDQGWGQDRDQRRSEGREDRGTRPQFSAASSLRRAASSFRSSSLDADLHRDGFGAGARGGYGGGNRSYGNRDDYASSPAHGGRGGSERHYRDRDNRDSRDSRNWGGRDGEARPGFRSGGGGGSSWSAPSGEFAGGGDRRDRSPSPAYRGRDSDRQSNDWSGNGGGGFGSGRGRRMQ
jgi:hypothetical protein